MSQARLARYLPAAKGDRFHALRHYVWNARLCEEFYIPLQFSEIALGTLYIADLGRCTEITGSTFQGSPMSSQIGTNWRLPK